MGLSTETIISPYFKNEQCNILPVKKPNFENNGTYSPWPINRGGGGHSTFWRFSDGGTPY